jgi:predicted RNA-binding Zn-ribbon protein involved in translation (DUF1610 family)
MKRFEVFSDCFTITCNKCNSTDITWSTDNCPECGTTLIAICEKCGQAYDYHAFKQIEVEYDKNGNEVKK